MSASCLAGGDEARRRRRAPGSGAPRTRRVAPAPGARRSPSGWPRKVRRCRPRAGGGAARTRTPDRLTSSPSLPSPIWPCHPWRRDRSRGSAALAIGRHPAVRVGGQGRAASGGRRDRWTGARGAGSMSRRAPGSASPSDDRRRSRSDVYGPSVPFRVGLPDRRCPVRTRADAVPGRSLPPRRKLVSAKRCGNASRRLGRSPAGRFDDQPETGRAAAEPDARRSCSHLISCRRSAPAPPGVDADR